MPQSILPPHVEQAPLTPMAELFVELDVAIFRLLPERRFLVRAVLPGEFDPPALAGDENGKPRHANAVITDRTRPRWRVAYYAANDADMPTTDREILAFMRRWGCAI
jgi:hypothetical protein